MTNEQEALYQTAEQLGGFSAQALQAMGLTAEKYLDDADAMRIFSFVWGRNARNMGKAAKYFEPYFTRTVPAGVAFPYAPSDYLSLFEMASLGEQDRAMMFEEWGDKNLAYWQVKEQIATLKAKRKPAKKAKAEPQAVTDAREIISIVAEWDAYSDAWGMESGGDELVLVVQSAKVWMDEHKVKA